MFNVCAVGPMKLAGKKHQIWYRVKFQQTLCRHKIDFYWQCHEFNNFTFFGRVFDARHEFDFGREKNKGLAHLIYVRCT